MGIVAQDTVELSVDENDEVLKDEKLVYLFKDILGTTVRAFDEEGVCVQECGFEPFGKQVYAADFDGSTELSRSFTGHFKESADGLYYCHARWYDADIGRFLQADSVLDGLNRYCYCGNNPVGNCDPTGESVAIQFIAFVLKVSGEIATSPTKEEHYARNENNEDLGADYNAAMKKVDEGKAVLMKERKDQYHEQGTAADHDPSQNDKVVSKDGKSEGVYNRITGQKITDPVNQGTYNRADPNTDPIGHFIQDMVPYYRWGNSPDDPTTVRERITGSYEGDVNITKEEAVKDRAQRRQEKMEKTLEKINEHH